MARKTTAAMPPTTPPTIAPVLFDDLGAGVDVGFAGVLEVGLAVGADEDTDVDTSLPLSMYTPFRDLQQFWPLGKSILPQQRLLSPQVVIGCTSSAFASALELSISV